MTGEFTTDWLSLREPADATARSTSLLDPLVEYLPAGPLVVRDLGCGTGSNRRWLADRLPGPQRWILHDQDPVLLERAAGAGDATRLGDFTTLRAADLAGTSLVTASAVLDVLTAAQIARLMRAVAAASVPVLFTLTVSGLVDLTPMDPLDEQVAAAFNRHQRRGGRCGPAGFDIAAGALSAAGYAVEGAQSSWRLGAADGDLTAEWLRGWCAAAAEEAPELELEDYQDRRLAQCAAGRLRVAVHHVDLLGLPDGAR